MAKKKESLKYVTLDRIKKEHCQYNWLIGQRSNGKTYAVLKEMVENYGKNKKQSALIRRWKEDFRGKRGSVMFDSIVNNGLVERLTDGQWTGIYYYASRWYLCKWDDELNKRVTDDIPFCYGFSLSEMEHDKSTSYPDINIVMFDEAISRNGYITDEFVVFCNVLSTIIRQRDDVVIYMLGNTVNKFCPYFVEMGLNNVKNMQEGDLQVYSYGESKLHVAVQFTDSISKEGKPSDVYFAFNNPKLQMITGRGQVWELDMYPHCPMKYERRDILFIYFISFNEELLQCEIVYKDNAMFTYIHRKSTPIKDESKDIIFSFEDKPHPNWRKRINKPYDTVGNKILDFFKKDKVFYQDNEVGETVRNYIMSCQK